MSEAGMLAGACIVMIPVMVAFDRWLEHLGRKRTDKRNKRNPPLVPDMSRPRP